MIAVAITTTTINTKFSASTTFEKNTLPRIKAGEGSSSILRMTGFVL